MRKLLPDKTEKQLAELLAPKESGKTLVAIPAGRPTRQLKLAAPDATNNPLNALPYKSLLDTSTIDSLTKVSAAGGATAEKVVSENVRHNYLLNTLRSLLTIHTSLDRKTLRQETLQACL